jgi:DNA-binding response OmpR family regulator
MTEHCCCPTCGSPIHSLNILVSLNGNTVTTARGSVRLSAGQAEIAWVLNKFSPAFVPVERLLVAIHGRNRENLPEQGLRTQIKRLRRLLDPIGVKIDCIYNTGYRIGMAD